MKIQRIIPKRRGLIPIFLRFCKDNPAPIKKRATLSVFLEISEMIKLKFCKNGRKVPAKIAKTKKPMK